jgi:toxin-antitoxin system PIN domain toxin
VILCDVNIYVYAHRKESPDHDRYRQWLAEVLAGSEAYGVSELTLSAFVRIVTNRRIYPRDPSPLKIAMEMANEVRSQPQAAIVAPGPRHWAIFAELCDKVGASGDAVPDAYLAALAIESGSEWITADRGFARFPGLRWRHPLDQP